MQLPTSNWHKDDRLTARRARVKRYAEVMDSHREGAEVVDWTEGITGHEQPRVSTAPMPNQNKPSSPLHLIEPHIRRLWKARLTDRDIVTELRKHIDTDMYGIGVEKQKGDTYKLSIGGTGVTSINNKLYTILQETPPVEEWIVTYRAHQKAYSIAQKSDGRVWVANNELYSQIEVWHGIAAGSSPTYPTSQLFKFVRADRDKD
ncbi:hypothetical protein HYDPIDRAFT_169273 [Hydnomerulius pinastri MD-312]|uniref:Uncharacterized protein n=1 Tax=Hydnomerulius pinastri MD-312 TaxID=994086 RepID=A0A0C9WCG6_9AGAM|nr:hypothetical protein HYDPIDRAFT_169273 [Hydnomerulius pinastri MD-312]